MAKSERSRILRVGSNNTRRCRSSLDLSDFAKGPASRISRAPLIRCATKMNIENERSDSTRLKAAELPQWNVMNWRRRSSGLRRGLESDTESAARINRKTFSESFSKWVRNGSTAIPQKMKKVLA